MQDFGGQGCGVPHRRRRALGGMPPGRLCAKTASRQGAPNVFIGNSQFALDVFVQRFY